MDCSAAQTRNLKTATQSKLKIVSCHFAPVIILHVKKSNSNFFYLVLVFIAIKCNQNMKKICCDYKKTIPVCISVFL